MCPSSNTNDCEKHLMNKIKSLSFSPSPSYFNSRYMYENADAYNFSRKYKQSGFNFALPSSNPFRYTLKLRIDQLARIPQ